MGLDLNYVSFINNGYKYTIYDTYSAEVNGCNVGIEVTNLKSGIARTIEGLLRNK